MIEGYANIERGSSLGLLDRDWQQAIDEGRLRGRSLALRQMFDEARLEGIGGGRNLQFDNWAAFSFNRRMAGPDIADPYDFDSGSAWLATITLTTIDSEPTYQEASNFGSDINNIQSNVGSGASKRFVEDDVENVLIATVADGRDAIFQRSRFLYLPSQAVSGNIRSVSIHFSDNGDSTGFISRGIAGRVRIKDAGQNPIIISKSSSQVLLVEYTTTYVSS